MRVVLCLQVLLSAAAATAQDPSHFFEMRVRPVLSRNCMGCHGSSAMGGLRLDSREYAMKGGKDGAVIVPGDPDGSLLIQAVRRTHERLKMPPQARLKDEEVSALAEWVKAGAVWPELAAPGSPTERFWSFRPVHKPPVPAVNDRQFAATDIDRFIAAKLEANGLKPVRKADKRTLIRRASFDLTGLPPSPEDVNNFLADNSPDAFAKVVDRLLASPRYGERWGRYWLDLARYSDGQLGASKDTPFPNSYRYRDWVIQAFNEDLPYDQFVKAQIAGDLMDTKDRARMLPGLGFYALGPDEDDRVDVTGQVFLGLTVGCARCHDHKYDPIPTKDYYSLLGIFRSTERYEFPLAADAQVEEYKQVKKQIEAQKNAIEDFVNKHSTELTEILAEKTSRYVMAAWEVLKAPNADCAAVARTRQLDETTLKRWVAFLKPQSRDHKFLQSWDDLLAKGADASQVQRFADDFQRLVMSVFADKHAMDDRNYVKLGGAAGVRDERTRQYTNLESLPIEKYYLWRDLASEPYKKDFFDFRGGVYYYGPKEIDRFLSSEWREHHQAMKQQLQALEKALPPQYPFLHTIRDNKAPADIKVYIRGDEKNQGEVAPRRYLACLSDGERPLFRSGSGRLELANVIANPANPLFARVMVNRIWQHHFGHGLAGTPSNFGQTGERPTHAELLDYLASIFVEKGWSIKAMHRAIMLSAAWQLSTDVDEKNMAADPANHLLWRANLQKRLDAEALRDTLLAVSGELDTTAGGPAVALGEKNHRRTIYALIGRTKPDAELALFDFPNPNGTSEQRLVTVGPMQRLYFMNSSFVTARAQALAQSIATEKDDSARVRKLYGLLFSREPGGMEVEMALEFVRGRERGWPQYVQTLLASAEFSSVN